MAKIFTLGGEERLIGEGVKLEPDAVLKEAMGKLACVVVIGQTPDGEMWVSSTDGGGDTLWLLEKAKLEVLSDVWANK